MAAPAAQIGALSGVTPSMTGLASGLVETMREIGGAVGVAAIAARIEGAGSVAVFEAEPERIVWRRVFRHFLGRDQKRHGGDLLVRMTREVIGSHNIDARRVYIAGMSAGGAMAASRVRHSSSFSRQTRLARKP